MPKLDKIEHECNTKSYDNNYSSATMGLARVAKLVRPLAYSSEVGEAFRSKIPILVKPLYMLSFGYVIFDTYTQVSPLKIEPKQKIIKTCDTLIWHGFASLLIPGVIVHGTVKYSDKILKCTFPNLKYASKFPPIIGLMSIFAVVHYVDSSTDALLNSTTRKLYTLPKNNV
jgi:hypothetical protein